ncbi:MAG: DUF2723 domain-containing protein [Bacteroidetes bacterium]|nr:DUF2723 domain-containing protein [Bacteroidota bacterium]MCL5025016.1 DUF2723 domain-containing protein [Chloroflexota bacterium]
MCAGNVPDTRETAKPAGGRRVALLPISAGRGAPLAILVFILSLALYTLTLPPGLLWGGGDFATFQTRIYLGDFASDLGIFGHPLWVIVAHPFSWLPIRDVAWRANFATAVFAAAALTLVFLSARILTRSNVASLLAAGALAVSHTFWTYAVMPKVYSLDALLLAACIYLLLRWRDGAGERYLYPFAFLYGLSFLNHLIMVTAAAGFAALVVSALWSRPELRNGWRPIPLAGVAFGLGIAPYLYLASWAGTDASTAGTAASFLGGLLYVFSHPRALLVGLGWGALLGAYQYPITVLIGLLGIYYMWQRDRGAAALVGLGVLGTLLFMFAALDPRAGSVYVWNLHYYLQAYVVFALALAAGFAGLWSGPLAAGGKRRLGLVALSLVFPVLLYAAAPTVAQAFWRDVPDFRPLPGRDNLTYVLSPWKQGDTGARELGENMLGALPPGSTLLADYSLWAVVRYLQVVEKARPDVRLVRLPDKEQQMPVVLQYRQAADLYLSDVYRYYDVEGIQQYFEIVPAGPVYRLVARRDAP